tara:strand:+ start:398 stop:1036 length:639 start_codon:yes stop_codon:yes gene_type:complete
MHISLLTKNPLMIHIFEELKDCFKHKIKIQNPDNASSTEIQDIIISDEENINQIKKSHNKNSHVFIISNQNNNSFNMEIDNITFIQKPFRINDLINRIVRLNEQKIINENKLIYFDRYVYDFSNRILFSTQNKLRLTEKENEIFYYLLSNKNKKIFKEDLLKNVWNYADTIDTHTLETHIYSLRKKILKQTSIENLLVYEESNGYSINTKIL